METEFVTLAKEGSEEAKRKRKETPHAEERRERWKLREGESDTMLLNFSVSKSFLEAFYIRSQHVYPFSEEWLI